jgi:hypothetical protein
MSQRHAIGIISGGLDSLLAVRLVQRMGFEVTILHFVIGFEPRHLQGWIEHPDAEPTAAPAILATGAQVEVIDLRAETIHLLADPPHGFGGHCNPCIDCHAMMLRTAADRMAASGAAFVFTGEVLGQRPMSQNRQALATVAKQSGLGDRLVRPLSGRLLEETAPQREGLFQPEDLLDIRGRSRRRQKALAVEFGLTGYPTPAGGCLLTDPGFSVRLRDQFERREGRLLQIDDPLLLYVGRHLVLPSGVKLVVGRDHRENGVVARFAARGPLLEAIDHNGPTSLIEHPSSLADWLLAARLTARYGQGRAQPEVAIRIRHPDGSEQIVTVEPGEVAGTRLL